MTTEQQYRVIADRDEGDDPLATPLVVGDRVTYELGVRAVLVRIERPVTERRQALRQMAQEGQRLQQVQDAEREVPTREQIAKTIGRAHVQYQIGAGHGVSRETYFADAVLALIQNGADR